MLLQSQRPVVWLDLPTGDDSDDVIRCTAVVILMCRLSVDLGRSGDSEDSWHAFCLVHEAVSDSLRQPPGRADRDTLPYSIVAGQRYALVSWQHIVSRAAVLPVLPEHATAAPRVLGASHAARAARARFIGKPLFVVDLC